MLGRLKFNVDELAEVVLDSMPQDLFQSPDTTFLDPAMAGGQFLKAVIARLRKYNHTDENIASRITGYETNKMRINFAAKQCSYIGNFVAKDFMEDDMSVKFDVVIGNPPYQDPDNDKKMLWNAFLDKSQEVCKPDGYIAMVTPATWIRAKTNIHNSYRLLEEYQVEKAVVYAKNDTPFENVGSTISYHITKNTPRAKKTPIYYGEWRKNSEQFIRDIDIANDKIWPGELTPINLSIHDKLLAFDKIKFIKSCEFHNQKLKTKKLVSDQKTDEFPYTHHVSAAITRFTSIKFSKHSEWKVMVPLTSTIDKAVVDKDCGHGEDMLSLYVDDEQTALNIQKIFQTDAFKFIGKMYKNGRNQVLQNIFPVVDFSKSWTSDELLAMFGLTEEEKEHARNYS